MVQTLLEALGLQGWSRGDLLACKGDPGEISWPARGVQGRSLGLQGGSRELLHKLKSQINFGTSWSGMHAVTKPMKYRLLSSE